jgi:hypothetical protein
MIGPVALLGSANIAARHVNDGIAAAGGPDLDVLCGALDNM